MNIRATLTVGTLLIMSAMSMAAESIQIYIRTASQGQIMGSSQLKGKEKWIEVISWSMGRKGGAILHTDYGVVHPQDSGQSSGERNSGGQASGERMHSDITISKYSDKASALLMRAFDTDDRIVEVKIAVTGADGKTKIGTLSGVAIDWILVKRAQPGLPKTEDISFAFQKITWN